MTRTLPGVLQPVHITCREGVCGGEPIIDGLRVTVRQVATQYLAGDSLVEIADAFNVSEAQVAHALSYFFDHRDEIKSLMAKDEIAHVQPEPR